mmetsp:Transcript_13638/g.29637  ORF Transcript_13638/g.29637 Transcript_13638/m.29637 type:complete len:91 (-) Transcript_13638:75-347(-)
MLIPLHTMEGEAQELGRVIGPSKTDGATRKIPTVARTVQSTVPYHARCVDANRVVKLVRLMMIAAPTTAGPTARAGDRLRLVISLTEIWV